MTIKERNQAIEDINKQIKFEQKVLTKKIHKYFKGILPTIEHNSFGLDISIDELEVYELDSNGMRYNDCITEELATKIKNDFIACYGEIEEYAQATRSRVSIDMADAIKYNYLMSFSSIHEKGDK